MQEVFEKIIEKLEEYMDKNLVEHDSEQSQHCKDVGDCGMRDCALCVFDKAVEIVKQEAEKYIKDNDCMRAKDINAKDVVAYRYLYNEREITQFYAVLDDGTVYYKYGGMYEHIGRSEEAARFEKERDSNKKRYLGYEELTDYRPAFRNMYKCVNSDWLYATARYQYING